MIKHVIFTDHALAKVFCYDLAGTLTLSQQRGGTLAYSAAQVHPDGLHWAVAVDDSNVDVMTLVTSAGYTLVDLDSTWYPDIPLPIVP